MSNAAPKPEPTPAEAQMREAVSTFQQGVWARFATAHETLSTLLKDHMPKTPSLGEAGLSPEQTTNLVVGHWGLCGEYGNGIGHRVSLFDYESRFMTFEQKLRALVDKLDGPSQLTLTAPDEIGPYMASHGLECETSEQALWRSANLADRWADANAASLAPETVAATHAAAAEYRAAYTDVLGFVQQVRDYLGSGQGFTKALDAQAAKGGQSTPGGDL